MMIETEFSPGDVVMVKSGGPALTVLGVEADKVKCLFFSEELGTFEEANLPRIALVAAEEIAGDGDAEGDEDEDEEEEDEGDEDQPGSRRR